MDREQPPHGSENRLISLAEWVARPLQEFLRLESAGGLLLVAAAVLALVMANSPWSSHYAALIEVPFEIRLGSWGLAKPLLLWVNDGLMAVFFFLVGLELKREVVEGHLSTLRQASLPVFAALGGMVAPALIYVAFNREDEGALRGWGIPMATDIAFALGVLALLKDRVPPALKVLLLSVAILDDLGAILVIALFYVAELSLPALLVAGLILLGLAWLNRAGVTRPAAYLLPGLVLWVVLLKSGVHATLAGVLLAMAIPLCAPAVAGQSPSPLVRLEHALHPWVAFGILPLFAFANSGIPLAGLSPVDLLHPVPLGIAAGLVVGKPLGILLLCGLAIWGRVAALPEGVRWPHLCGLSILCGIGFTMSLFIASLAFEQGQVGFLGMERLGILAGSLVAGLAGYAVLRLVHRRAATPG